MIKVKEIEKWLIVIIMAAFFLFKGYCLIGSMQVYLMLLVLLGLIFSFRVFFMEKGGIWLKAVDQTAFLIVLNVVFVSLITGKIDTGRIMLITFSFLFFAACKDNMSTDKDIAFFYKWYIFFIAISSLFAIGQYFEIQFCTDVWQSLHGAPIDSDAQSLAKTVSDAVPDAINEKRYLGLASDALMFAYQVCAAFILTLFTSFKRAKPLKPILLILFGFAAFANSTRSAWIVISLATLFYAFKNSGVYTTKRKAYAKMLAVIFVAAFLVIIFVGNVDVFQGTRFDYMDSGASARIPMVLTAFNHALHKPFGYGIYSVNRDFIVGATAEEFEVVAANTAHNLFGNCVANYGFIGLFLMIRFYYLAFKGYKDITKTENADADNYYLAALICIFGLMINAMFHNSYILSGELSSHLFFAVIAAGASSAYNLRRESK